MALRGQIYQTVAISLRGEVWVHKTSLTLPCFIEVHVPNQASARSCMCVLGEPILPLSTILQLVIGTASKVCCFVIFILS